MSVYFNDKFIVYELGPLALAPGLASRPFGGRASARWRASPLSAQSCLFGYFFYTSRCVCVCVCVSSLHRGHANLLCIVPICSPPEPLSQATRSPLFSPTNITQVPRTGQLHYFTPCKGSQDTNPIMTQHHSAILCFQNVRCKLSRLLAEQMLQTHGRKSTESIQPLSP